MRIALALCLVIAVLAACARGAPEAVVPETEHDFGDVPVATDRSQARVKEFAIRNEGTADLKLRDIQIKTLEGC
jgi:hypothetical protein